MATDLNRLKAYIEQARQRGFSDQQIIQALLKYGVQREDINKILSSDIQRLSSYAQQQSPQVYTPKKTPLPVFLIAVLLISIIAISLFSINFVMDKRKELRQLQTTNNQQENTTNQQNQTIEKPPLEAGEISEKTKGFIGSLIRNKNSLSPTSIYIPYYFYNKTSKILLLEFLIPKDQKQNEIILHDFNKSRLWFLSQDKTAQNKTVICAGNISRFRFVTTNVSYVKTFEDNKQVAIGAQRLIVDLKDRCDFQNYAGQRVELRFLSQNQKMATLNITL